MALAKPSKIGAEAPFVFLESRMNERAVQKFRKLQHRVLGLTEQEWLALRTLLASYDALGVAVQRHTWFAEESTRLRVLQSDATGIEQQVTLRHAQQSLYEEARENRQVMARTEASTLSAAEKLKHRPIYRALYHRRKRFTWFHGVWMFERC
ncbi:hypothetical protein BJY01DRAFT_248755 [Aspergillus pseudoustus]|uniref:SPX domain-containing protein n=1 Tax=Aspergillus pseudoustus TaxID=1810923 RepID=A0ABR4JT04_9EURO